ncbi:AfsR/SARP family transcriptional regulator [Kibdelosporangium aridum]|uniref:AfsR/SARP family transcriptional regulator n=1 Tax=Kibdelosporangium aridum TaxID=2030 RepID=UPI0035EA5EEA
MTISAPRQRVVLAALLLNANRVVPVERLAECIWDGNLPSSAYPTVRTYVMRLRQVLGEEAGSRIVTRSPGYMIQLDRHETDLSRFGDLRRAAALLVEAGDLASASIRLREALDLWHHAPLMDVQSRTLCEAEVPRLEELRVQTFELHADVEVKLGRHAGLIPVLWREITRYPLREGLAARLMLALFHAGQQARALEVFRQVRTTLVEELGTEPGTDLQQALRTVLSAGAEDPPDAGTVPVTRPRPAQLPAAPPDFTCRERQLKTVHGLLAADSIPGTVSTVVITGGAGCGKSALAIKAAHGLKRQFRDGQLYAELSGSDPRPARPARILSRFLTQLGVGRAAIPQSLDEMTALYRSLVADTPILVVLDDAADAAQVRPLIPGGNGSGVIITSRRRLPDLEGARTIVAVPLDEEDSIAMLAGILGRHRVEAEPVAARSIAANCGGMPLAIRIAAARLLDHPHWSLTGMAERLADTAKQLDELQVGDLSVRGALSTAFAALNGPHPATALRMLGAAGVDTVDATKLAVLMDCDHRTAEGIFDQLLNAHLLSHTGAKRYTLPRLHRTFAAQRSGIQDAMPVRAAALQRLLAWYESCLRRVVVAARLPMAAVHLQDRSPLAPEFGTPTAATDWLGRERHDLLALLARAGSVGLDDLARPIARAFSEILRNWGYRRDAQASSQIAAPLAECTSTWREEVAAFSSRYHSPPLLPTSIEVAQPA